MLFMSFLLSVVNVNVCKMKLKLTESKLTAKIFFPQENLRNRKGKKKSKAVFLHEVVYITW